MADSPQRLRLDTAIDSADPGGIGNAANQWTLLKSKLTYVADTLEKAQGVDIRGLTGASMRGAFGASANGVREKVTRLEVGRGALEDAARAQERARAARTALDSDPALALGTAPTAFQPDPDKTPAENQTARGLHQGETDAYWDRHARREAEAKRIADQLDRDYADAAEKMKQIHGEPDPVTTTPDNGSAGGGRGGGVPRGGGRTPGAPSGPHGGLDPSGSGHPTGEGRDPSGPRDPGDPTHPTTGVPTDPTGTAPASPLAASDTVSPAQAGSSTTGGGLPGGAAGGLAAGIAGGLGVRGLTNAIRGGLASPGQATRAGSVRPIGSTSRSAVSGALGRAGGAPAGSTARSATGGSGAGRGAAGRAGAPGQASGQRGGGRSGGTAGRAAGARGGVAAGAAGAGRGRGSKDRDEETVTDDLFDDGQDWIDDADAASGVLD